MFCRSSIMSTSFSKIFPSGYALAWEAINIPNHTYFPSNCVCSLYGDWIGKYVSEKRGINTNEPSLFGIKKRSTSSPSWHRKCFNGIIDYTTQKQLKLDVPVNRMIIFTGYYFIFAMFLACLILDKSLKHNRYCFSEWH